MLGRAFMFLVGAAVGYCLTFYYADLLWVRGSAAGLIAGFVIAPLGGLALGTLSALFVRGVAVFLAAAIVGYFVVAAGWLVFADVFDIADREGGKGMAMIFIFAPAAGAVIGLIAAALLTRPREAAPHP